MSPSCKRGGIRQSRGEGRVVSRGSIDPLRLPAPGVAPAGYEVLPSAQDTGGAALQQALSRSLAALHARGRAGRAGPRKQPVSSACPLVGDAVQSPERGEAASRAGAATAQLLPLLLPVFPNSPRSAPRTLLFLGTLYKPFPPCWGYPPRFNPWDSALLSSGGLSSKTTPSLWLWLMPPCLQWIVKEHGHGVMERLFRRSSSLCRGGKDLDELGDSPPRVSHPG